MSPILVLSILIRLSAMGWSVVLLRRVRDARMGFLTAMLALMAMRQILTLWQSIGSGTPWRLNVGGHPAELPGLLVSVLAALSVIFLERFIMQHRRDEAAIRERDQELLQAQKMEAVGQLAGGIAHDFNNLLTVILANVELIRLAGDDAERRGEHLVQLETAGLRAAALTRQLLTFARKQKPERKPIDLNRVLREMQPMMRRLVDERIELSFQLGDAIPSVEADATQISQVLINLIVNAQHAIEGEGGITVRTAADGGMVCVAVEDDGGGIAPEVRGRIFEPFFTTKPSGEGSGLGLSICFGIVQEHGGCIDVRSQLGVGTTFEVSLPAIEGEGAAVAEPPAAPAPSHRQEVILVVEDDAPVRAVTCEILRLLGYRVLEAVHGLDALEALQRAPEVQLVLADIMMPKMGGIELRSKLESSHPKLPVQLMSGYSDHPVAPDVRVLSKPFTQQALATAVRDCLDAVTSAKHG